MKKFISLLQITFFCITACLAVFSAEPIKENYNSNKLINRIEGIVWDPYRRPVSDVYVELQNENYSTVSRIRTDSTGRFSFIGISPGHYNVKVLPSATNYLEVTEGVDIIEFGASRAGDSAYLDIYLKFDKRKLNNGLDGITDVVFVQDVPEEARRLYKQGVKNINEKGDKGFNEIDKALVIFPNYYDALNMLGREYVVRKEYQKALPYLIKSIDVNQRSFSSFYALGYAAYQLNHRPEAIEAVRAATILQPNSPSAQLLLGTLLRLDGSYEKSEKSLLQAKNLSKNLPIAEIHWQLALLYNKLNRNKEAADELEFYLKIQPDSGNNKEIKDLIAKLRKESK